VDGESAERTLQGWVPVAAADVAEWNGRLLAAPASLFQLPYWNEPLRALRFVPRYLAYWSAGRRVAFACVLSLGIRGARFGFVQRGPVSLVDHAPPPDEALHELTEWGKRHGYVFLRFTHSDPDLLDRLASLGATRRADAFPFYHEPRQDLLVPQRASDDEMLASFQRVARQNLRKAAAAGYRIEWGDAPETLSAVWPLFEELSRRKGFSFRPRDSFLALLQHARPFAGARVYVAYLGDRPVQALLIARDREVAHNVIGALDVDATEGRTSPSELLHWLAMRDFARLGTQFYNLGTRSGAVYEFKRKFHPLERTSPPPVTVVTNAALYRAWSALGLTLVGSLWPRIKRAVSRSSGTVAHLPAAPAGARRA